MLKWGKKMEHEVIFSSEYVLISKRAGGFYIESFRGGMSIEQFNKIMGEHAEIKITNFMAIKNALLNPPHKPEKFGEEKERVHVEVANDELKAYVTLSVPESELASREKRQKLIKEVLKALESKGVVFGISCETIQENLCNGRQILAAEGVPPVNGEDSVIRMYELKEARPEIKEDGNVDHYELNLINKVKAKDWLGERIDATKGTPGKSVMGKSISPVPGKMLSLLYDKDSVKEIYKDGVTALYALRDGAVSYQGDKISVSNHLEISDGIDFKTGNIDFDGFLTVKGSIEDNFAVAAMEDIEILGDYGVGSVKEIVSRKGSVYIKGGIAGKNRAVIKSKKDIYTKFVSDATIICEGRVHIGFYCLNSNIIAKEVILDSMKGQIIGGSIQAEIKVVASIIGSPSEKRTHIAVKGFNRQDMKHRLDELTESAANAKNNLNRVKQELATYPSVRDLDESQKIKYEKTQEIFSRLKADMKSLDDERKSVANYLRTRGEGEVSVLKRAYPGTVIELRRNIKELSSTVLSTTFYLQDSEIKSI